MSLKDQTYFKEKENLNGKKDICLILDCYKCPQKESNFFKSKKCIGCFLKTLFNNRNHNFEYVLILCNDISIKTSQFEIFLDYFKKLKTIKRIKSKIEKIRNQKCKYKEFTCKIFPNIPSLYNIKDIEFLNPILIYNIYSKGLSKLIKENNNDSICQECCNSIQTSVKYLLRTFDDLKIIQKFKEYKKDIKTYKNYSNFYEYLLSKPSLRIDTFQEIPDKILIIDKQILDTYTLGNPDIYRVLIFEDGNEIEKHYRVQFFFSEKKRENYLEKIIQDICNNIEIIELDHVVPLEELIEFYERESLKILNSKYKFSNSVSKKIGFLTAIQKLNLEKLFPLLIDDFIEEIFLDSPKDEIYINHQIYGRCRTKIKFNLKELDRIKALIRLYSGKRLDFKNPSIKFVIKNKYFYCRFSIDVEPIQIDEFALDIRKLNKNIFTIQDLLKNGTIDPLISAFLYFNILHRKNITVTGETDTGKTTLINALDLLTPKEFRKIYIENITESLNQIEFGKHQLKYRVDSLEESVIEKYSKGNQIKTLLHRTPDIIYLGEILTKEEAEAMFQCLAAGLRGFQTIHSKNLDSLINRFLYHFKINKLCLHDLDLIILMKKKYNERKVVGVFEINESFETKNELFNSIFEYNPQANKWILTKSLYETNVVLDIKKYEHLTKQYFLSLIKVYNEIFEFLLKLDKIENMKLIEFFHKISYYSAISLDSILHFWSNCKKNRSLYF
jgi:type IV secretory pathway ATPase VirB11/archaellum biosynthesis ATPase